LSSIINVAVPQSEPALSLAARFEHGLDVYHRSAVDRLEVSDADAKVVNRKRFHDLQAERIWAIGRARGEDALQWSRWVPARMDLANVSVGQVKPRDDDDVIPGSHAFERRSHAGIQQQPAVRGVFVALARRRRRISDR
jgi:hypothetical protein